MAAGSSSSMAMGRREHLCSAVIGLPWVLLWAAVFYWGLLEGPNFLQHTDSSLQEPAGSPSQLADHELYHSCPQKLMRYTFPHAVVIVAKDPLSRSVWAPEVAELTSIVLNATLGSCGVLPRSTHSHLCWWRKAAGIFVARDSDDIDLESADYVSPDNVTATMIVIDNNHGFGLTGNPRVRTAWHHLQAAIDRWLSVHGGAFTVGSTHEQMILDAAQQGIIGDFEHGDMITLPIAWLILLLACGPSAGLALVTLPVTLLGTFASLDKIATGEWLCQQTAAHHGCRKPITKFATFVPAIFINMMIAISLDYTCAAMWLIAMSHDYHAPSA